MHKIIQSIGKDIEVVIEILDEAFNDHKVMPIYWGEMGIKNSFPIDFSVYLLAIRLVFLGNE